MNVVFKGSGNYNILTRDNVKGRNCRSVFSNINKLLCLDVEGLDKACDISDIDGLAILAPYAFGQGIFCFDANFLSETKRVSGIDDFINPEGSIPACAGKNVAHVVSDPVDGGNSIGKGLA